MRKAFKKNGGALLGAVMVLMMPTEMALAGESTVTHQIIIKKFKFVPETLTIRPGDRIEWVNQDFAPHTATEKNQSWDTDRLSKGQAAQIAFSSPGDTEYFCRYHPNMRGKISVSSN